jgi:hypothetical protein
MLLCTGLSFTLREDVKTGPAVARRGLSATTAPRWLQLLYDCRTRRQTEAFRCYSDPDCGTRRALNLSASEPRGYPRPEGRELESTTRSDANFGGMVSLLGLTDFLNYVCWNRPELGNPFPTVCMPQGSSGREARESHAALRFTRERFTYPAHCTSSAIAIARPITVSKGNSCFSITR